jgi:hypothetical protein
MSAEQTQAVIDHVIASHREYQRKPTPSFSWEHVVEAAVALGIVPHPDQHGEGKCVPLAPRAAENETDEVSEVAANGSSMIAAERARQVTAEGYDAAHDDAHKTDRRRNEGSPLLAAAGCYIHATNVVSRTVNWGVGVPMAWPWNRKCWKPATPIRMLVKAGALIAAEIDRRLRAGETP